MNRAMIGRRKAQRDSRQYLDSAVTVVRAGPGNEPEPRPFSPQVAMAFWSSWVYAASMINAKAVAALPLRLYVREGSAPLWRTRGLPRARKDYLTGRHVAQPSRSVRQKAAEWGDEWEEIAEAHPVLELLSRGTPNDVGINLMTLIGVYLQMTGNAYLHPIIGPMDVPSELWHMPPQWTWVIPATPDQGRLVDSYMFGRNRAEWNRFEPDEVIHLKAPNPRNLYYGAGWIETGWNVVQQNEAGHEMDLASLRNHSRPDYLVVMKPHGGATPGQAAIERFGQQVGEKLRGRGKAGQFLSISGDVDVKPLAWPPKDLKGREEIVEEIAAVSGVPVSMLRANDPNLASARAGYAMWRENTVQYWATLIEEHFNELLLPLFGLDQGDAVLAFDSPVIADEEAELRRVQTLYTAGIIDRDEARTEIGYEAIGDARMATDSTGGDDAARPAGDGGVEQAGTTPTDPAAPPPIAEDGEPRDGATDAGVEINGALLASVVGIAAAVRRGEIAPEQARAMLESLMRLPPDVAARIAGTEAAARANPSPAPGDPPPEREQDDEEPVRRDRALKAHVGCDCGSDVTQSDLWRRAKAATPMPDDATVSALDRALRVQREAVRSYLTSAGANATPGALLQLLTSGDAAAAASSAVVEAIRSTVTEAARDAARRLPESIRFTLTDEGVARIIQSRAGKVVTEIGETTARHVSETLARGVAEGKPIPEIARELAADPAFSRDRAEMIARTETSAGYNRSQLEVWQEAGVEKVKWLLAPDPCEFCEAAAARFGGNNEHPIGEPMFRIGDVLQGADGGKMRLDFEDIIAPPLHPNCRCTLDPVTD